MSWSSSNNPAAATPGSLPTLLAAVFLMTVAVVGFYRTTLGFRVLTYEDYRRERIAEQPRRLPDVSITRVDASGAQWQGGLLQELHDDGRVALLEFFYSRCTSLCSAAASELQQTQELIREHGVGRRVRLLAVSFDPRFDRPQRLRLYADRLTAQPALWTFAVPQDAAGLRSLLRTCGVLVMPDGAGGYRHDSNLYLVSADGFLRGVYRLGQFRLALRDALAASGREAP